MGMSHHGTNESRLMDLFMSQKNGTAQPQYPSGKLAADDLGETAAMMTLDVEKGIINLEYAKSVKWVAMTLEDAVAFRDLLSEKILELRGIPAV